MSKSRQLESILEKAESKEKKYNWLEATEFYEQASAAVREENFLRKGEIKEKIGYCFHRATMQSEKPDQFRTRIAKSIKNYRKARKSYLKTTEPGKSPRILRCDAMIAYMGYWLTVDVSEKKRFLAESWQLAKQALEAFAKDKEALEYGKTYNQLSTGALLSGHIQHNFQASGRLTKEGVEYGEQAIGFLSTLDDQRELVKTYVRTSGCLRLFAFSFLDLEEREKYHQKASDYWLKANEISEETAMIELLDFAGMASLENSVWGWGTEKAVMNFKQALEYARKTRDRFIMGWALDWLDFHTVFMAEVNEDPDEVLKLYKSALQYAEDAKQQYSAISFTSPLWGGFWVEAPYAWYYWVLATYETNLKERRDMLEIAARAASDQLKLAEYSGIPLVIMYEHHHFSRILFSLAKMETNRAERKQLLERALEHRKENIRILEQCQPFYYWKQGRMLAFLADVKSELSDVAVDSETKRKTLEEALSAKEKSLKLGFRYAEYWEGKGAAPSLFADLGKWQYEYGNLLKRHYRFTNASEDLRNVIKAFEKAVESFQKVDLTINRAECHWKIAQTYDTLGDHLKAAECFEDASNDYKRAASKIPQLEDFYLDHALYMRAWSEIEKAKDNHMRREYSSAKKHFEKAADLHKSLKQWSYLAPNYSAWAQVEHAEVLSREEQSQRALKAFDQAANLFNESKRLIQTKLDKIGSLDEKQLATKLATTNGIRREYCLSRILLEEAKILDRRGDHAASSRKYDAAAEKLQKAMDATESESERRELRSIVDLSRAWHMMTRAEAEASPTLFLQASSLFQEAKEHSLDEKAKVLALAHSHFCKALEAGTRFEDTRDASLHLMATKHLESASDYYIKSGFKTASDYAKATQRLLDAYVYVHNAKTETDPEQKAKFYGMAEKLLETSAASYMRAMHAEKSEEVQRLLESVKEERQLAMSLTEVLHAPTTTSTTTSFSTPSPIHEQAAGLERFEHADIQARLLVKAKETMVGEDLAVKMELVNAGKAPALLVKVDETVPEGFEIKEVPEVFTIEDSCLNMKGKMLNPLKTEAVKMVVKPRSKGTFTLKPRILYADETGKYKSHEPEPVTITVRELGISGWIKGER